MNYIESYQKILLKEINSIEKYVVNDIISKEKKIVQLNINQILNHQGNDDNVLISTDKRYREGTYKNSTEFYYQFGTDDTPPSVTYKSTHSPYNFTWTGDFISNFELDKKNLSIFSTGTGSGNKKKFFDSYKNMFGLNAQNENIILDEVLEYVYNKIMNNLWR